MSPPNGPHPGGSYVPSFLDDIPFMGRPPPPPPNKPGLTYGDLDEEPVYDDGSSGVWGERANEVKKGFLHAYGAYEKVAFGWDEILPESNKPTTNFNGWGVTIVDSLDTMILMGLASTPTYTRALEFVAKLNMTSTAQSVHFFETVIRYLGGFLSAGVRLAERAAEV